VHVPRVMKWAGLVAYDLNFALNENEAFDGVGIAWFDNRDALRVFQTAEGQSARSGAVAESSKSAIFLTEEVVIVRHPEIRK
jgi:hypothetical protein